MSPPKSTPVTSQDISPLLAAARAAKSSKKKKGAATEKENASAEPPAARRKRAGPVTASAQKEAEAGQPAGQSLEEISNQLAALQGV